MSRTEPVGSEQCNFFMLVAMQDEHECFREGVCIEWSLEGLENNDKVERVAAQQPLKVDFVD